MAKKKPALSPLDREIRMRKKRLRNAEAKIAELQAACCAEVAKIDARIERDRVIVKALEQQQRA